MLGPICGWISAAVLSFGTPRLAVAPSAELDEGPRVPALSSAPDPSPWVRSHLAVHPRTRWSARTYPGFGGGRVIVLREHWDGIPVAGASLALRVTAGGRLRQVVGESLALEVALPPAGVSPSPDSDLRWWPGPDHGDGLVLARLEDSPMTWEDGAPVQTRRLVAVDDGRVLAEDSALDHATLEISGWRENPLSTPTPESWQVFAVDADPLVLENDAVRVMQCIWQGDGCDAEVYPTADTPGAFLEPPPGPEDTQAHTDPHDPWVGPQAFQYATRIVERFEGWGWDPMVWDVVDCSVQGVPAEQCKLFIWVNVLGNSEDGAIPYDGAYHHSGKGVYLGQGQRGDVGFDLQILAHEIMHHVQRGYGDPEPTSFVDDGAFWRHDIASLSEGTSDLFARFAGESDELYQYFRNQLGLYQGPYRRDVSVPFRCPENVTGQVHMEGRIWAAAWFDVHLALVEGGLAGPDDLPSLILSVVPAIRQLPAENPTQFANASKIVLDEIDLSLGADAYAIAEEIVRERGLVDCSYVVDLQSEPSVTGEGDLADPYHARFLTFRARKSTEDPSWWDEQPNAPAVQHRLELGPDETGATLRFVPDLWHRVDLFDEPFDGEELEFAALIKEGEEIIRFQRNAETNEISNDAEWRAVSEPDPERGSEWRKIVIEGLEPGTTHQIALVTLSPIDNGKRAVMQSMEWSIQADPESSGCGCDVDARGRGRRGWLGLFLFAGLRARRRGGQQPG